MTQVVRKSSHGKHSGLFQGRALICFLEISIRSFQCHCYFLGVHCPLPTSAPSGRLQKRRLPSTSEPTARRQSRSIAMSHRRHDTQLNGTNDGATEVKKRANNETLVPWFASNGRSVIGGIGDIGDIGDGETTAIKFRHRRNNDVMMTTSDRKVRGN